MGFFSDLLLSTSRPYRMGANILAQNYGPAVRGMTGKDPLTPGPVERFAREGVTQEEQNYIDEKPYKAILKSSAGMASLFGPSQGSNISRTVFNNATRNALQSAGASEIGSEGGDALRGALLSSIISGIGGVGRVLGDETPSLPGNRVLNPEKYDDLIDTNMPISYNQNTAGYNPALQDLISKYSNYNRPSTYSQFMRSVLPENRGEVAKQMGSTLYKVGSDYIRPNMDTSNLVNEGYNNFVRYVVPLLSNAYNNQMI